MRIRLNTAIGGLLAGLMLGVAVLATVWVPWDPLAIDLGVKLAPPSATHWLGTDEYGRDVLSRAMTGAATSGGIALVTVLLAVSSGTLVGMVAGFTTGWLDRLLMALNDALLAFPGMLIALGVIVVIGPSRSGIVLALGLAYAPAVVRVVRGTVLSLREKEYVEASRMIGNAEWVTMLRHVMPNCITPVVVLATSMFGWVLLAESALSFLGLGVAPPAPTWGNMLAGARSYLQTAAWLGLVPGVCIAVTLLGINLLGDGLRDRFDPRTSST